MSSTHWFDICTFGTAQIATFGTSTKRTDYAGEFVYENSALQFVNHEEGRIVTATTKLVYTNPGESLNDFVTVNATTALFTQNAEKYVKVTSGSTVSGTGVFPVGGIFPVATGEVYRVRVKGYRTGSNPAYLLIKVDGVNQGWPGATLASSADTEAWTEQYVTISGSASAMQVGVAWNTVTSGESFYVNEFEVTKLGTGTPEYQYHLKDHLGNVRMTFTTNPGTDQTTATYEPANQSQENSQYVRYSNARLVNATLFNHTTGGSYSERLSGSANEKYGLAKSISVMPGDVVTAEVYAKYVDPNSANWTPALTTLMGQITSGTAGVVIDGANYSSSTDKVDKAWILPAYFRRCFPGFVTLSL
ncbi:MAG: hypothetical protein JST46_15050 [Bacteroidetes bacterium]|nr:hypothetical protein [Bacteroidota bacterium]